MSLRDKLCQKKIFIPCLLFSLFLSFLFCVSFSVSASAASLPMSTYGLEYELTYGGEYYWSANKSANQYFNNSAYWYRIRRYQFNSGNVIFDGQYATVHFETNIVASQPTAYSAYLGDFVNRDKIKVTGCFYDGSGSNWMPVQSQYITTYVTNWEGPAPSINYKNKTLTVIGDIILSTSATGTHSISCVIGNTDYNFWLTNSQTSSPIFYVEQNPTTIEWSGSLPDPVSREQVTAINSIEEGNQRRWETEREEQDAKEEELESQADGLSLSANVPTNPLFRFFVFPFTNVAEHPCYTTEALHSWFNSSSPFVVCSPLPYSARQAIVLGTNFIFLGLLLRLYFKKLKGGIDG